MPSKASSITPLTVSFDDLSKPTGNFWIDTGIVVLHKELGKDAYTPEDVLQWILDKLIQSTGNKGRYYDEHTGEFKEYDKRNWIYPANLFIKVSGSPQKTEISELPQHIREQIKREQIKGDKKNIFTSPPEFKISLSWSKKEDTCDICGATSVTTGATMYIYPFIVDPSKFANFYSYGKQGLNLCPRCALAGIAAYLGWLWKAQGGDIIHIFVFHSTAEELHRLHKEVLDYFRTKGDKSGTAPLAFSGRYTHETALGLVLELFRYVKSPEELTEAASRCLAAILGADSADTPTPLTLYLITGKAGQSFGMQAFYEFSRFQKLYKMYESWLNVLGKNMGNPNHLANIFRQFQVKQGDSMETIWRDKVAKAILEMGDPLPAVEEFLFDARAKEENPKPLVSGTLDVLTQYLQTVYGMTDDIKRILAGFGHSLGEAAQKQNDMGLLYALRNAKSIDEFLRVLNDVQYRLNLTVPERILEVEKGERIADMPWLRLKTLLSIYAMNRFLQRSQTAEASAEPRN